MRDQHILMCACVHAWCGFESDTIRCMSLNVLRLYFVRVMFETHVVL